MINFQLTLTLSYFLVYYMYLVGQITAVEKNVFDGILRRGKSEHLPRVYLGVKTVASRFQFEIADPRLPYNLEVEAGR